MTVRPGAPTGRNAFWSGAYFWLQTFVGLLVGVILAFTFVGSVIHVEGESMFPTLHDGDLMLVQRIGYTPAQGDVVVLTKPFHASRGPIVKRVVAVGGQAVRIDYDAGLVYVDGAPLEEPYLNGPMHEPGYGSISQVLVPEGCIFVMGDNRNHSADSRDPDLGVVDTRRVIGCARLVLFPFHTLSR